MADGTLIFDTKFNADALKAGLGSVGSLAAKGVATLGAASLAAAGMAGTLVKASVEGFAELEQLIGGVETLFGGGGKTLEEYATSVGKSVDEASAEYNKLITAQEAVIKNSENAYKDAGLSANEYMNTITGFSASLISSLGGDTEKAAEVGNKAVIDMADNANKMGTSIELIQNAYQGFAKQNYTMLDNLKLGYGGTKEEMQRLLADASAIAGVEYDISSYADVIEAIHTIQEEMGIAGATANEAATTIQGSLGMMSAAWSNLVTGMADENADLDTLINQFVESVGIAGENILPVLETALIGMGTLIEQLLPQVAEKIPTIIASVLPGLLTAGADIIITLLNGIVATLPTLIPVATQVLLLLVTTLVQMLPQILQCGIDCIVQLALGIAQALPSLIPTVIDIILQLAETLIDNVDMVYDAAIALILGLAEGLVKSLPTLIEKAPTIISKLCDAMVENAPKLIDAALQLILVLAAGIIEAMPSLIDAAPKLLEALKDALLVNLRVITKVGENIVKGLWDGISQSASWLLSKVGAFAGSILAKVKEVLDIHSPSKKFGWVGKMCIEGFDQEFEDYDPYETLEKSMKAHKGTLSMSYNATLERMYGAGGFDYEKFGEFSAKALAKAGITVQMDRKELGRVVRSVT